MSAPRRPRRRAPQRKPRVEPDPSAPLALALDTSGATEALALVQGDLLLADQRVRRPRRRGTALGVAIRDLLASVSRTPADLSAITVGLGPGAFTGLRVGIATAHGLAGALGVPLFGFDSTHGLACAAFATDRPTVVILDARRDEVYAATYAGAADGTLPTVVSPTRLLSPAALAEELVDLPPSLLVGDGARLYASQLLAQAPHHLLGRLQPGGPALGPLAADALRRAAGGERPSLARVQPTYLRDHDAAKPKS
ncbi:MAG: tRNA (adenosine(37)-N6)-threonylcarbamoyltransferase complex dimerization subunit type 1 TsaB [Deltaproteobacteria bacterium]|nr:tRNA (adenosine(37)-N6)-threonylcarbamoyltransferase complex dimerization subunit type 1 TsaB [Deltaproteobacteria bacterium]